jgi:glycosyltransferase involved in cell wall biosynthesis
MDWIQAHFAWVAATTADALATARDQEYSVFAHAHDIFEVRLTDRYTADKLQRAAFVLVESPTIAAEVRDRFGCRTIVQRMGVPIAEVVDRPIDARGRLVLSVGSLTPKKGHDDLIRAVARIDGCELDILGEGHQRAELEALIGSLGCSGRVRLVGAVTPDEVQHRMAEAAVFCLASKPSAGGDRDGVPNVLIEAMARGVPVVSTRLSGIPDLIAEDRGLLVEPGDVDGLERALRAALDDPGSAARRAAAALAHVRSDYTTERNWQVLEGLIRARLD